MRISGGQARGVRLTVPRGARPASERVRQAVFSSLGAAVRDAVVLDLYCGSGAYGLEALSRGAARAVFVDRDAGAVEAAKANAAAAGVRERCAFRRRNAAAYRAGPDGPFDLAFVDPPYDTDPVRAVAGLTGAMASGGRVVVETRWRNAAAEPPDGYVLDQDRRYGDTRVLVFRREAST